MKAKENEVEYQVAKNRVISGPDGLEWYVGPDEDTSWDKADAWVKSLKVDGGGWRLPTLEELQTLYQEGMGTRNMPPIFKTTGWWVWSVVRDSSSAWYFNFHYGTENWYYRDYSDFYRVFAVRSRRRQLSEEEWHQIQQKTEEALGDWDPGNDY